MRLYRATYVWTDANDHAKELPLYILAPDFQTATNLAETNEKISPAIGRALGGAAGGDMSSALAKVEVVAFYVIQQGGNNTKYPSYTVITAIVVAVMLIAGCTSAPEKDMSELNVSDTESQSNDRYVQINLLDGTSVGGKYVSETAAFTTINVMYMLDPEAYTSYNGSSVRDPDKYIIKGNGAEVAFKNSLIDTVYTIADPEEIIDKAQQEVKDDMNAAKEAYDQKMKRIMEEKARYEAERAKSQPTNK